MFYGWESVQKEQVQLLLSQLIELFSSPDNWIFWPIATNADGFEVEPTSKDAVKWSLMGACEFFTSQHYPEPMSGIISSATREYLNDLSGDDLIHGLLSYEKEMSLLLEAVKDLKEE